MHHFIEALCKVKAWAKEEPVKFQKDLKNLVSFAITTVLNNDIPTNPACHVISILGYTKHSQCYAMP